MVFLGPIELIALPHSFEIELPRFSTYELPKLEAYEAGGSEDPR